MRIEEIHFLNSYKGHKGAVYQLCAGIEKGSFLSAGSDGLICQWNPAQSNNGLVIAQTGERIFSLLALPDQKMIFAGSMQGDLFLLNILNEPQVKRFRFHQASIYSIKPWNQSIITAGGDGILAIWNPENGSIRYHLKISHQKLRSLAIDAEQDILFAGDGNGHIWKLKLPDLELIQKLENIHSKTVFSLAYLSHEHLLISGGLDAHIKVTDNNNAILHDLNAHWYCVNDLCPLSGTNFIATASRDKTIRIWDKTDWSLAKEISSPKFAAHIHSVNSLLWNKTERILYSAGDDGAIFAWKIEITN